MIKRIKRKIYKLFNPPLGEVLMLHRVVTQRSVLDDNRLMEITPEFLEQTILDYRKRNYQIISLDELSDCLQNKRKNSEKFVCFTFDDGYADNYSLAFPVFKKYNCPFAIYLTTDFPDGKALLWWYVLEDILLNHQQITLGDGTIYTCETMEQKNQVFQLIREKIFAMQDANMLEKLTQLLSEYSFSFKELVKANALSWEQIVELSKEPLCIIASHTISHAALDKLNESEVIKELKLSKNLIEDRIKKPVYHFAYPYGRVNELVQIQVKKTGYRTAVVANGGVLREFNKILNLNRLILTQDD